MVAALYIRYRQADDHFLSALWARSVVGLSMAFLALTLLEIIEVWVGSREKLFIGEYFGIIFFSTWAVSIWFDYKKTLPDKVLIRVELYPEDYSKGNKLAFLLLALTLSMFIIIGMHTKDI